MDFEGCELGASEDDTICVDESTCEQLIQFVVKNQIQKPKYIIRKLHKPSLPKEEL